MAMPQNPAGAIPHPSSPPIYNDIMWISLFVIMAGYLLWSHRNRTELSNTALMFIGAGSMFWQEYYQNWGGYLLYSPDLNLLPWGSTWWTSPNKPAFLIFSYPVFYMVIYTLLVGLIVRVHRAVPSVPALLLTFVIAAPIFYGYNFLIDGASVDAGIWNYVDAIGPVVRTPHGGVEPVVWPAIPFCIYGSLMVYSLLRQDENGHPLFLRLGRPERFRAGPRREGVRIVTAILWWNATYWLLMTMVVNIGRELIGHPSMLVP